MKNKRYSGHSMLRPLILAISLFLVSMSVAGIANPNQEIPLQVQDARGDDEELPDPWRLAHEGQQVLARDLLSLIDEQGGNPSAHEVIELARLAIEHRQGFTGSLLPENHGPMLQQLLRNLDTTQDLIAIDEDEHGSDLHRAVAFAKRGTTWQTHTLGLEPVTPVPLAGHASPSAALMTLAARHGEPLPPEKLLDVSRLDSQPEPLRSALTRFVDAYIAMDTAAKMTYEATPLEPDQRLWQALQQKDPNPQDLHGLMETADASRQAEPLWGPDGRFLPMDLDVSLVLASRNHFLDAILDLESALRETPNPTKDICLPVQVSPAFSIDLTFCDNTYTEDYALQLDVGGDDRYFNNAGGSGLATLFPCTLLGAGRAAALVDLGGGNDAFGDAENPRGCGVNGGGFWHGAGFLLSDGGNNEYTAGGRGVNGGGWDRGIGFLLDADGDDVYKTLWWGGTNGGGTAAPGFLVDGGGNDLFLSEWGGTNGGGFDGAGFLLNAAGDDNYHAVSSGVNGGASIGVGYLLDLAGDDTYKTGDTGNGGGVLGVGFQFDAGGNDSYLAKDTATNGGGLLGVGFLVDVNGHDQYVSTWRASNGGASSVGVGFLIDGGGDDVFEGGPRGVNGGAFLMGMGFLLKIGGDDRYVADGCGANGGGKDDTCPRPIGWPTYAALGFLLDTGGRDYYEDYLVECWDCTVNPKGDRGAQIDSE